MFARLVSFARDASGAVAPLFAVSLIGLVGVGALAWDVSRGYALRGELEAAVDAAALAGATQLDGGSDAITRATTAAQGALVQNSNRLANAVQSNTIGSGTGDTIRFLDALTDTSLDPRSNHVVTDPAQANFIEITLASRPMSLVLGGILGIAGFNARAHAVAGYGSAICKVPPMMICNPAEPGSTAFDPATMTGKAVVLTPAPNGGGGWSHGMFGFLTVNGTASGAAIKDAMARMPPLAECYGDVVTPRSGTLTGADDWFNMRFDIYTPGVSSKKTDPLYPPAMNTMIGAKTNSGSSACNPSLSIPATDTCTSFAASPSGMGMPRDCNQGTSAGLGSGVWNVRKYFATNHSGIDPLTYVPLNKDGTTDGWDYYGPHAATGVTSPTRYQVYGWEKAILAGDITKPAGAFSDSQDGTTGSRDYAKPQCNTTGSQAAPDRRTISVVILNCEDDDAQPNHPAIVRGYVDLFLLAPAVSQTIFAEIIEATEDTSAVGEETKFYSVRLYE